MEIEIWACCYSEKADVSISIGTSVESIDGCAETLDVEWIYEGVSDSFWENHEEFEDGISKAEALHSSDNTLTLHQALYKIFGDFALCYEVDGKEVDLNIDFNANASMYALLET